MAGMNLQDLVLNQLRKNKIPMIIFLVNGVQIRGKIEGYDAFTIVVVAQDGKQQMVYKHAVSTIVPYKPIPVMQNNQQEKKEKRADDSQQGDQKKETKE